MLPVSSYDTRSYDRIVNIDATFCGFSVKNICRTYLSNDDRPYKFCEPYLRQFMRFYKYCEQCGFIENVTMETLTEYAEYLHAIPLTDSTVATMLSMVKYTLRTAKVMDIPPYEHVFLPWIIPLQERTILGKAFQLLSIPDGTPITLKYLKNAQGKALHESRSCMHSDIAWAYNTLKKKYCL